MTMGGHTHFIKEEMEHLSRKVPHWSLVFLSARATCYYAWQMQKWNHTFCFFRGFLFVCLLIGGLY